MYEKINFKDRIIEKPMTFNVINNEDGTITLIPVTGEVYQEGTEINATSMDHIEEGIKTLENNKQNQVLSGTSEPTSSLGKDGDIYLQYSE